MNNFKCPECGDDMTQGRIANQRINFQEGSELRMLDKAPSLIKLNLKGARCGEEHTMTSADSVQSLVYYYNWCLSKCRYSVVCKWDADMLMSSDPGLKSTFKKFLKCFVHGRRFKLGMFPIQTVYNDTDTIFHSAKDEINAEIRLFPKSSYVYFTKGLLWEELTRQFAMPTKTLTDVCVYEIKDVADDEFSHWTTIKFKNSRKVTEYRNYLRVKNNMHKDCPADFISSVNL